MYNGDYYSWLNATTSNNPTGSPLIDPNTFGWDRSGQTYELGSTFDPGYGYWVFSYQTCELLADVNALPTNQITDLEPNWNLIGIPTDEPISKSGVIVNYDGSDYTWAEATTSSNPTGSPLLDPNIFGWDSLGQTYEMIDTFEPGKAYWLFSYQSCTMRS